MAAKPTRTKVVDCQCKTHRPHGTAHGYNTHKCGCELCREAYQRYAKRMYRAKLEGKGQRVDPTVSQDWVKLLRARGMSFPEMSRLSGINHQTLSRLLKPETKYVRRSTQEAVRSVPLPSRDSYSYSHSNGRRSSRKNRK